MKTILCVTAFDRPDLLERTLENLVRVYPSGADRVIVYLDGTLDSRVRLVAKSYPVIVYDDSKNQGIAVAAQRAFQMGVQAGADVLIHADSDFYIKQEGWARKLGEFVRSHPEVGIASPDIMGRYMRIHRPGYDEIEYAMGAVMAVRTDLFKEVSPFHGDGFFDKSLHHQWDPDTCLRVRLLGYRVAIIPLGECVHLGEGSGDSSKSTSVWRGGFEFLKKWNLHFTGQFRYKSPMMLRWDEFPQNYLWRRQWLAQFPYNERNPVENIQGHRFEMVQYPVTPGKWMLQPTRDALKQNVVFSGCDEFEQIDPDLLAGKRQWGIGDLKR